MRFAQANPPPFEYGIPRGCSPQARLQLGHSRLRQVGRFRELRHSRPRHLHHLGLEAQA